MADTDAPSGVPRTRLVLIRHAESLANTTGVLDGHDVPLGLTERGRAQAAALRDRLLASGGIAAAAFYTSRLCRAIETATVASPAISGGTCELQRRCELCEIHWGDLEGRSRTEYTRPDTIYQPTAQGGESWVRFMMRCRRALEDLAARHADQTVVVVTHGGVIRASMCHFARVAAPRVVELDVAYTGITVWSRTGDDDRWRLETYNDHAHLG